ncbi:hypothetical protein C7271_03140 [filamentous cyanobacterium CCP5]|nr:hypothetical protein C7271_03140 [filamentous cyanobacterium CCP5]
MSKPSPLHVLLLEDEPAFTELVEEYLLVKVARPWRVLRATRLCEALTYLRQQPIDVILSDLHVPDAQGLETLMALRKAASGLPVVVLTEIDDPNLGIEALRKGAQDYLGKHEITPALLERSLCYAIERVRNQALLQQNEHRLAQLVKARTTQLQREARRRQVLFDASLDGIVVLNQQGRVVEANPRFASALGYSLAEISQLHISDWIADVSLADLEGMVSNLCREKTECTREVRHCRRDGSLYYAELNITVVDWEQTPLLLFLCRDISERKQAEADLRASEQKHRALLAALPDLVMHIDGDGNYLDFFPPKTFNLFRTATPNHSHVLDGNLPAPLAEQRMQAIQQALQTGNLQRYEQQITIDGQLLDEEVRINPLGENEVIAIIRDITDRKQAELALAQSEATNRAIVAAMPDLLIQMHRDGNHSRLLTSPSAATASSDVKTGVGRFLEVLPTDLAEQRLHYTHQALASGQLQVYEQTFEIHGQRRDEEVRITPLNQNEVLVIVRDICDRKQAERELHQLNQQLEARINQRTAALQASESRLRSIFDQSPVGIAITDLNGQINQVNPSLITMLGTPGSELLHRSIYPLLNLSQHQDQPIFDALFEGTLAISSFEQLVITPGGDSIWVKVISARLFDGWGHPSGLVHLIDDITPERKAKVALEEITHLQRAILNSTDYAIISTNTQGQIQTFNAGAERLLGYSAEEVIGQSTPVLFHELSELIAQANTLAAELARGFEPGFEALVYLARSRPVYEREWTYVTKQGDRRPIVLSISALRDSDRNLTGYLAIAKDITSQKRAEQEAQELRERLEFALTSSAAVIFTRETTGRFKPTFVGDNVRAFTGYSAAEMVQNADLWMQLYHPEDQAQVLQQLAWAVNHGEATYEYRYRHQDGSYRWMREEARRVRNARHQLELVGYFVDVSQQKAAESALRQSEARYRAVVEDQTELICRFLSDGTITFVNQACCDYFQIASAQLMGQNYWQWLRAEACFPLQSQLVGLTQENPVMSFEHQTNTPNGGPCWQFWTNRAIFDFKGQLVEYQAVGRDISDRKRAEAELRTTNEHLTLVNSELHRATRLKDEFLASISHELRTPLNAILGMTEGLTASVFGDINARQQTALDTIDRSGRHLLALINDILDLSKVEAGKLELQKSPVDIPLLCESSLTFVKQQAQKKHIHLSLKLPGQLPTIDVDQRRIQQVLLNLLTNAVKFTPEGGRVRLVVSADSQPKPQLVLAIIDTGIGIASEHLPKLFKPFVQIDNRLNRSHSGTGLGLALVRRLVELHGGTVSVDSTVGKGSCFTIKLPYPGFQSAPTSQQPTHCQLFMPRSIPKPPSLEGRPNPVSSQPSALPPLAPLVLLAEDNEASAASMMGYLSSRGYRVAHRRSGREAIELAILTPPNIILIDIQMPDLNGIEATRRIRAHPDLCQVPIIALTTLAMAHDQESYLAAGVNAYLSKPVQLKYLVANIQSLLNRS